MENRCGPPLELDNMDNWLVFWIETTYIEIIMESQQEIKVWELILFSRKIVYN